MSAERAFLDTNVLIYAFVTNDLRNLEARRHLAAGGIISVQVLNEFCAVARAKLQFNWPRLEDALSLIRELCGAPAPLTQETHDLARSLAREHDLHIYDASIVAAAQLAGCALLYSEDLQHGRRFDRLVVKNPFATA